MRGLCSYESLKNGSLNLDDMALLNDALDVQIENNLRAEEWKAKHG